MTLLDVAELMAYWAEHPPVHVLLGSFLGIGRGNEMLKPAARPQEILARLGPGFHAGDVHAGLDAAVLDFATLRQRSWTTEI
jgi:hypothetical protein